MTAMAMTVTAAQGTLAWSAPNAQLGGSVRECGRVAIGGKGAHGVAVQDLRAVVVWRTVQSRRCVVRAQAAGEDASIATAATTTTAAPAVTEGGITEVDKDTFWPIVKSAGEKLVVLDMYTQWCGPCKLMLPKIQALAETMDDVIFCKLDCNQENKSLAKELGIRVVPTFKIFKASELVTTITGAKYDNLVAAIESARKG